MTVKEIANAFGMSVNQLVEISGYYKIKEEQNND